MAWLSLVIVTLIFFAPGYGIAPRIVTQDMVASISLGGISAAIIIPGTGPLRLFVICFCVWAVIWLILYIPDHLLARKALRERKPYRDFLSRIGLWHDLVNSFQRYITGQVVVWLARFVFWGFIAKLVIGYLLQLALDKFLPVIANWLVAHFSSEVISILQGVLRQGAQDLTGFGMNSYGLVLFVFALLVLIVNRAYAIEQHGRLDYATQQRHFSTIRK